MARQITFKGATLNLLGNEIKVGDTFPDNTLAANDMSDFKLSTVKGKKLIISTVPSLDTPVCSEQTKKFNKELNALGPDVKILTVSLDLPFAQKRWCGTEGVENIITLSDFRGRSFGKSCGAIIAEWGLLARAVFVVDRDFKVTYVEYVPEVSSEPNYTAALSALKSIQ